MNGKIKTYSDVVFAENWIKLNISSSISLKAIANEIKIKPETLSRHFVRVHGVTVSKFVQRYRLELAIQQITKTDINLETIAYDLGYSDLSSLRRLFIREKGVTPSIFRECSKKMWNDS